MPPDATLLIACPDATGIVAATTSFLSERSGNIIDVDQHTDTDTGLFFMRIKVERRGFELNPSNINAAIEPIARRYKISWRVHWHERRKRVAILASKEGHCLSDLLYRWRIGELDFEQPLVISNHSDLESEVQPFGLEYVCLPVAPETKVQQEAAIASLLQEHEIDTVILARYMQILTPGFVDKWPAQIINIHHSFLPAFAGPKPYHRAFERGVKLIGATAHYVTADLDEGPIIAQETCNTDHRDQIVDLVRKGRDLERMVLAQAVRLHLDDRVLITGNKTVVFDG